MKNPSEKIIHGKLVENWAHYHDYSPPLCISPIFSTGFWRENIKQLKLNKNPSHNYEAKSDCRGKQQTFEVKGVGIEGVGGNV